MNRTDSGIPQSRFPRSDSSNHGLASAWALVLLCIVIASSAHAASISTTDFELDLDGWKLDIEPKLHATGNRLISDSGELFYEKWSDYPWQDFDPEEKYQLTVEIVRFGFLHAFFAESSDQKRSVKIICIYRTKQNLRFLVFSGTIGSDTPPEKLLGAFREMRIKDSIY